MSKQELKKKIKEAVERDPLHRDIKKVALFGSYLHGNFKDTSDVDVLIEFLPSARIGFFKLSQIKRNMEQRIDKPVDLLTPEAISRHFRDHILKEAEIIYEK